jgi:hypothetical protein
MRRVPPAPILARVLLLLLAAGAVVFAWFDAPVTPVEAGGGSYACPMHPAMTSQGPGTCPVCGMELVLRSSAVAPVPTTAVETLRRRVLQHQPRAWASVEAEGRMTGVLFVEELDVYPPGVEGLFQRPGDPGRGVRVRRTHRAPVPHDASTSEVEFQSVVAGRTPPPGTLGWIDLPARAGPALVVPSSAVLQGPEGPFVLVQDAAGGQLSRRPVTVGRSRFGTTVLLSGVSASDRVAVRGAFFLDAEQTLAGSERR